MSSDDVAKAMLVRAEQVSREIQGRLHGLGSKIQGAVLADLVSLWLAGHFAHSGGAIDPQATQLIRDQMFADWVETVIDLVPESEKEILDRVEIEGSA